MSKGSIKITGHSLQRFDKGNPTFACCSCGAWGRIIALPSAKGRDKARRNWHDEHKYNVWRRLHPEQFQEDRPVYLDMENE
jgi:hypothetical protein